MYETLFLDGKYIGSDVHCEKGVPLNPIANAESPSFNLTID